MSGTRKRVLLVDDDATTRALLRLAVEAEADVRECQSAEEALALMRAGRYDVVVTDHLMGFMQGADLLQLVAREHPGTRRVMATAYTDIEHTLRRAGAAHAFISKPIDVRAARAAILGG